MKDRATPPPESVASDFLALRRKERRPLNVEQSRTFEAVARHSIGADRRCYGSREKLADFAGLHVRNLREALAWLVTEGLIVADGRARDDELPDGAEFLCLGD